MKKLVLLLVCLGLCGLTLALADVIYVSGDVSGTWSADTVFVVGEVRVPSADTLVIEPGVVVLFSVYCKFIVDSGAVLWAVGTPTDTILFDEFVPPDRHENRWKGIRFLSASNSSRLEYCHLKHGQASGSGEDVNGGAIYCSYSSPTIQNCLIDSCEANSGGGGIYCTSSSPVINSTTIRGNSASYNGGGIFCYDNSNPTISGNTISGNFGSGRYWLYDGGGGIYCSGSNPTISGNTISGNSAYYFGGGILCANSNPTISGNTISGNSAAYNGGGISCGNSSPTISGNTISGNSAGGGGGIYCYINSSPTISGNTITGNSASNGGGICCDPNCDPPMQLNEISHNTASSGGGVYLTSASPTMDKNTIVGNNATTGGGLYCTGSWPVLRNCILWGNTPQMVYQISGSGTQVTYSDCQSFWPGVGNIFVDPLFVDSTNGDYHLLCSSPCIDKGDPNPIYNDPDGTRADMGCYYFEGWTSLPVGLVAWMDSGSLRLAWPRACPVSTYNVMYALEAFPDIWSLLTTTTDTTITDDISGSETKFYCVKAVR